MDSSLPIHHQGDPLNSKLIRIYAVNGWLPESWKKLFTETHNLSGQHLQLGHLILQLIGKDNSRMYI